MLSVLQNYLPEAPVEGEGNDKKEGEKTEDSKNAEPSLQFSHVECTLFALHSLCRKSPEVLSSDQNKLKALRLRLQYTARLTQGYIKKLKEVTNVRMSFIIKKIIFTMYGSNAESYIDKIW